PEGVSPRRMSPGADALRLARDELAVRKESGMSMAMVRRWGLMVPLFILPFVLMNTLAGLRPNCELLIEMRAGERPTTETGHLEVWVNSTSDESFHQDCVP